MKSISYNKLLNLIARGESGGNYNAYFGHAGNRKIVFADMTVGEVLAWQDEFVRRGSASSAVGRYQFINTTLRGLMEELSVGVSARFDAKLQDRFARQLVDQRGAADYVAGHISAEQFAHNLSQEWAALPRVLGDHPEASYYDGDGLNKARIKVDELLAAIHTLCHEMPR